MACAALHVQKKNKKKRRKKEDERDREKKSRSRKKKKEEERERTDQLMGADTSLSILSELGKLRRKCSNA